MLSKPCQLSKKYLFECLPTHSKYVVIDRRCGPYSSIAYMKSSSVSSFLCKCVSLLCGGVLSVCVYVCVYFGWLVLRLELRTSHMLSPHTQPLSSTPASPFWLKEKQSFRLASVLSTLLVHTRGWIPLPISIYELCFSFLFQIVNTWKSRILPR